ncbi:DNA adenine methylase [Vibrio fluvialis]|nr:DNA adenine methylase [Vibrio fluvialis]
MFYSPLRYPGGKSKLTAYVLETLKLNDLEGGVYVEPFAGGSAISWYLLLEGHVSKVYINDLDDSIYAFWFCVLNLTEELCDLIKNTDVTMDEWFKQKDIQNQGIEAGILPLGFSTFFLNRTNHSGVIKGGVIGGKDQSGKYKLDCRYQKDSLVSKVKAIAERKADINLTNLDAVDFLQTVAPQIDSKSLINIDPPYYVKGKGLYQNFFIHDDHCRLFDEIKKIKQPWIVTYDDVVQIRDIYQEFNPSSFDLTYTAQVKGKGKEVIIHQPKIKKPGFSPGVTFSQLKKISKSSVVND